MKTHLASVSGGKDSTAMCLYLKEQGIEYRALHFDTGWEHPATVEYLRDVLPRYIGPIEVHSREPDLDDEREAYAVELEEMLGWRSPFVRWTLKRGMFPSRVRRFCTQELKIFTVRDVMKAEHEAGRLPVNVVGIRAAESQARAKLPERELSTALDCMVWRPLIAWTERDVIDIHHRHGVPPNPLYLRGSRRVGCWPCIHANKADLRLLDEDRILIIERLEEMVMALAEARYRRKGETEKLAKLITNGHGPRFYQAPSVLAVDGKYPTVPIRRMVEWGKTARGGRELDRQQALPGFNDGCLRWGMCES